MQSPRAHQQFPQLAYALQVYFRAGPPTPRVRVDYPVGHRRRRAEGTPLLCRKFEGAVRGHFESRRADQVAALFCRPEDLDDMSVAQFMGSLAP